MKYNKPLKKPFDEILEISKSGEIKIISSDVQLILKLNKYQERIVFKDSKVLDFQRFKIYAEAWIPNPENHPRIRLKNQAEWEDQYSDEWIEWWDPDKIEQLQDKEFSQNYNLVSNELHGKTWKPLKGREGLYEVSEKARIKKLVINPNDKYNNKEIVISEKKDKTGIFVSLWTSVEPKQKQKVYVSDIIAFNLLGIPEEHNGYEFIDGDKFNVIPENIRWIEKNNPREVVENELRDLLRDLLNRIHVVNPNLSGQISAHYGERLNILKREGKK